MNKITDIFKTKERTFSIEIFPPKTEKGLASLRVVLPELAALEPDFFSVTYGAGGGSRDTTLSIVRMIQEELGVPTMHHFTCVLHSREQIKGILDQLVSKGIRNILALRGDPPKDDPDWSPGPENFKYSSELVQFIRENYRDHFAIAVAGFPEGHPLAVSPEMDAEVLKKKLAAGGDFVMTQLFFDAAQYFNYVVRLRTMDVNVRVIPGILPITNYESAVRFSEGCGATVPQKVHDLFRPVADDPDKTMEAGIAFAVEQCRSLLAGGAPGLHFYALNKLQPVRTIWEAVCKKEQV